MTFTTEIAMRFSDLDAYGHVNNAVIFTYLETARFNLFRDKFADQVDSELTYLVAEANCRYLKPISIHHRVLIEITAENIGRSSFTLRYRMHDGQGQDFADAATVMVCYDPRKGATATLPEAVRGGLEEGAG